MISHIFEKHKKAYVISGAVLFFLLAALYLYAMFLPGFWYRDAFLYQKNDGSFQGSDWCGDYQMKIAPTDNGAAISFSVNEMTKQYVITGSFDDDNIQVFENGVPVFKGYAASIGDSSYLLIDEEGYADDVIDITVGNTIPNTEELFPNYSQLFNWAVSTDYNTRGNLSMILFLLITCVILALDIAFPDLFFLLEHQFDVVSGEPSDWYRLMQKISRVLLAFGILLCIFLGFTTH